MAKTVTNSFYSTCIVQGWSKLRVSAYFNDSDLATFEFTFNNEPIPDEFADDFASLNSFEFEMSSFNWTRRSASSVLRSIFYFDFALLEPHLCVWEETIYYHRAHVFERLRRANSSHGLRMGVLLLLQFELKPTRRAVLTGCLSVSSDNLLRRIDWSDNEDCGACVFCLDKFEETRGEEVTCLPCSHAFHYKCLAGWLPKSRARPLCRYGMDGEIVDELP